MPVIRSVTRASEMNAEKTTPKRASKQQNDLQAINNTTTRKTPKIHIQRKGLLRAADC
ncbi:hypothetical protein ABZX51_004136 [Aspergillus tubingensis]